MAAFDDVRLPIEVERGATGGPGFMTSIITMSSGNEQRNQDWIEARGVWNIAYGTDERSYFQEILSFFYARRGRARGFRFRDWSDYEIDYAIGTGDGNEQDFQIVKIYEGAGPHPYVRVITRPVASTVRVFLNDVEQMSGWTLQPGGIIRFAVAPADTVEVSVMCDFDVPVRFDVDNLNINLEWQGAGAVETVQLVELRE